jgi:hypothetical protein
MKWLLRVRRRHDWKTDRRLVRCLLVPSEGGAGGAGVFPAQALPGTRIGLPAGRFAEVQGLRLVMQPGDGERELGVEPRPGAGDAQWIPLDLFAVEGLGNEDQVQFISDLLAEPAGTAPPDAAGPPTVGATLPYALDYLYRSDEPLDRAIRVDGMPAGPLAVAAGSGLVFDAVATGDLAAAELVALKGEAAPEPLDVTPDLDESRDQAPRVHVLEVAQGPHGFRFRVQQAELAKLFDGEHRVRLERWVAASPFGVPGLERERRLPLLEDAVRGAAVHATDELHPAELVGRQLHYRVGIVNPHGRVIATGSASVLRERLDAPVPVTAARALAWLRAPAAAPAADDPSVERLDFEMGVGAALEDDLEWSGVALYAADRGLDACGFYGDADDLALLAGLSALDLSPPFEPRGAAEPAATPPPAGTTPPESLAHAPVPAVDVAARERLEGRWATQGLELLAVHDLAGWQAHRVQPDGGNGGPGGEKPAPDRILLSLPAGATLFQQVLPPPGMGRRYHLVRFRRPRAGDPGGADGWRPPTAADRRLLDVTSPVSACVHELAWKGGMAPVFQLERIPPVVSPLYLAPEQVGYTLVDSARTLDGKAGDPPDPPLRDVEFRIRHPRFLLRQDSGAEGAIERNAVIVPGGGEMRAPIGGFRLWVRDRVGSGDSEPFRPAATVQAVPSLVGGYRPLPLDASTPWRLDAPAPAAAPGADIAGLAALRTSLGELADRLIRLQRGAVFRPDPLGGGAPGPVDGELTPEKVFRERFAELTAESALAASPWDEDPRFAGTLVSALTDLGLCARLSLHIDVYSRSLGEETLLDVLKRELRAVAHEARPFVVWVAEDEARHPFATVLLMPRIALPTDKHPQGLRDAVLRGTTGIPVVREDGGGSGVHVRGVRMEAVEPATRVFGADRVFRYTWARLQDTWRHELEWCVEVLDRYARIRGIRAKTLPGFAREVTRTIDTPEARFRVSVPRTAPVLDVVATAREISIPDRLVFRYDDPPERRAAAGNALNATRSGLLNVVHDLGRTLAGREVYRAFLSKWPRTAEHDLATSVIDPVRHGWRFNDPGTPREPGAGEERLDLGQVLPYYEYRCRSWLAADAIAGEAREAVGRVQPLRLSVPGAIAIVPEIIAAKEGGPAPAGGVDPEKRFDVKFQLARLLHCHTGDADEKAQAETVRELFGEPDLPAVPVERLPDLELAYHFFMRVGDGPPFRSVPLFELRGHAAPPGAASTATADQGSTTLYNMFVAVWSRRCVRNVRATLSEPYADLSVHLEVELQPLPTDGPVDPALARLHEIARRPSNRPVPGYLILVRQGRKTPQMQISGGHT